MFSSHALVTKVPKQLYIAALTSLPKFKNIKLANANFCLDDYKSFPIFILPRQIFVLLITNPFQFLLDKAMAILLFLL